MKYFVIRYYSLKYCLIYAIYLDIILLYVIVYCCFLSTGKIQSLVQNLTRLEQAVEDQSDLCLPQSLDFRCISSSSLPVSPLHGCQPENSLTLAEELRKSHQSEEVDFIMPVVQFTAHFIWSNVKILKLHFYFSINY